MNNDELLKRIDDLSKRIDQLSNSSSIPRNVETALRERLGDIKLTNSILTITINGKICTIAFT